jgi:hypothetical protein
MRPVLIDKYNAFGVNRVGFPRQHFPLSISVEAIGDGWSIDATAASASHLVGLLDVDPGRSAVVLNVGQVSWLDDKNQPLPLRAIAAEIGVPASAHDVRWSSPNPAGENDLLVLSWADLPALLDGWSLYDISLFDLPAAPADPGYLALTLNTSRSGDDVLAMFPGSTTFFAGHDDCYFHLQTTDSTLPARLLAHLLTMLAGSLSLTDDIEDVLVPPAPVEIATSLLGRASHWTGVAVDPGVEGIVIIGLGPEQAGWRVGDRVADPVCAVAYHQSSQTWRELGEVVQAG